ncbi:hypothetical protein T492DRAFT_87049 [Pavlovales sp. CCMP2436]|nr:hypothetical protein T492DRAFT_87049 [Pavlovales sp. CCMP2436]|mmetsp:Transcript_44061/g.101855  ORF Transcript_44061/g.101855 Transcript_44061/m.101855 type:complete len:496 (+) Transcript_44061:564-2051(+)
MLKPQTSAAAASSFPGAQQLGGFPQALLLHIVSIDSPDGRLRKAIEVAARDGVARELWTLCAQPKAYELRIETGSSVVRCWWWLSAPADPEKEKEDGIGGGTEVIDISGEQPASLDLSGSGGDDDSADGAAPAAKRPRHVDAGGIKPEPPKPPETPETAADAAEAVQAETVTRAKRKVGSLADHSKRAEPKSQAGVLAQESGKHESGKPRRQSGEHGELRGQARAHGTRDAPAAPPTPLPMLAARPARPTAIAQPSAPAAGRSRTPAAGVSTAPLLKRKTTKTCPQDADLLRAVGAGEVPESVLQWKSANGKWWDKWDMDTTVAAITGDDVDVLSWLWDNGCPCNEKDLSWQAAEKGCIEVLKWARAKGFDCFYVCSAAAGAGHLSVLKWARASVDADGKSCCPCRWDCSTLESAAIYRHLHVLQWAYNNGCVWNTGVKEYQGLTCVGVCREMASIRRSDPNQDPNVQASKATQHAAILKWMDEYGCPRGHGWTP